ARDAHLFSRLQRRTRGALREVLGAGGAQLVFRRGQQSFRQRIRPITARPISTKVIASVPEEHRKKNCDKQSRAAGISLERTRDKTGETQTSNGKKSQPAPKCEEVCSSIEPGRCSRRDQSAMQFGDERAIFVIKPDLLDHALPG